MCHGTRYLGMMTGGKSTAWSGLVRGVITGAALKTLDINKGLQINFRKTTSSDLFTAPTRATLNNTDVKPY